MIFTFNFALMTIAYRPKKKKKKKKKINCHWKIYGNIDLPKMLQIVALFVQLSRNVFLYSMMNIRTLPKN